MRIEIDKNNFPKAIKVAMENVKDVLGEVKDVKVESVLIDKNYYNVLISYQEYADIGNCGSGLEKYMKNLSKDMIALHNIMRRTRGSKTLLVKRRNFEFAGFKNSDQ